MGVQSPTRRSDPIAAAPRHPIPFCQSVAASNEWIPFAVKTHPVAIRSRRSPQPGGPLAKVEKSRCREGSYLSLEGEEKEANQNKWDATIPLLRDKKIALQLNDPALHSDGDGVSSIMSP